MSAAALPPVLTVAELTRAQLAREITVTRILTDGTKRDDTRFEISPKGQRMLAENMAARAAWLLAHPVEQHAATYAATERRVDE